MRLLHALEQPWAELTPGSRSASSAPAQAVKSAIQKIPELAMQFVAAQFTTLAVFNDASGKFPTSCAARRSIARCSRGGDGRVHRHLPADA